MHLADACIQSDLQCTQTIHFLSVVKACRKSKQAATRSSNDRIWKKIKDHSQLKQNFIDRRAATSPKRTKLIYLGSNYFTKYTKLLEWS